MNQFLEVDEQLRRPRRSQQDLILQRLRKRVFPLFNASKRPTDNSYQYASLDHCKKGNTGRSKTQDTLEQNKFNLYQSRLRTINRPPISSKKAALIDSCRFLKQPQKTNQAAKPRKLLLPRLAHKKMNFASARPQCKDELVVSLGKEAKAEPQSQLVTFYPFKLKTILFGGP